MGSDMMPRHRAQVLSIFCSQKRKRLKLKAMLASWRCGASGLPGALRKWTFDTRPARAIFLSFF